MKYKTHFLINSMLKDEIEEKKKEKQFELSCQTCNQDHKIKISQLITQIIQSKPSLILKK